MEKLMPSEIVNQMIFTIRNHTVMLDSELSRLYGITNKSLLQAVRRNMERFPPDFIFQLTNQEVKSLRSQFMTSKYGHGGRRYSPYAFTEQRIAMLSSVIKSKQAIVVNIEIMRAFVRLRKFAITHSDLANRIEEMERHYDAKFKIVFDAIQRIILPLRTEKTRIGFLSAKKEEK